MVANSHQLVEAMIEVAELKPAQLLDIDQVRQGLPPHLVPISPSDGPQDQGIKEADALTRLYQEGVYQGVRNVTEYYARDALTVSVGGLNRLRAMHVDNHDFLTMRLAQKLIPDVLYTAIKYPNFKRPVHSPEIPLHANYRLGDEQNIFISRYATSIALLVRSVRSIPNTSRGMHILDVRRTLEIQGLRFAPVRLTEVCENDGEVVVGTFDRLHRSL